MTKASDRLPVNCPKCGNQPRWLWRRFTNAGGHLTFPYVCNECGWKSRVMESKRVVMAYLQDKPQYKLDDIPELPSGNQPLCEVCGHVGAELHHYAPSHLFGNDADNWPTGYLCIEHHREWHDKLRNHK